VREWASALLETHSTEAEQLHTAHDQSLTMLEQIHAKINTAELKIQAHALMVPTTSACASALPANR